MYTIMIFKGEPGHFVTIQHYDAAPPFPKQITLDGKLFDLTVFEDEAANSYLVAHDEPLNEQYVKEVILEYSLDPLPKL